jgi:predicted RNase H-like nuclease (RuvC/YqgF family)
MHSALFFSVDLVTPTTWFLFQFSSLLRSPTLLMQVEMLKGLTTTLKSVAADMEKEIVENRQQKQEALDYRVTKAQEVTEIEKALATDIRDLTKRRDELEAELNEVRVMSLTGNPVPIHTLLNL